MSKRLPAEFVSRFIIALVGVVMAKLCLFFGGFEVGVIVLLFLILCEMIYSREQK
jgi:hypothetical protein